MASTDDIPNIPFALSLHGKGNAPLAYWEDIDWKFDDSSGDQNATILNQLLYKAYAVRKETDYNCYSVKYWLSQLDEKKHEYLLKRFDIYHRALSYLPRSYKLWINFLKECELFSEDYSIISNEYQFVNCMYERSLVHLMKMPRIWIQYLIFLMKQPCLTRTRRAFDRALQSLALTQHHRIWPLYIEFVNKHSIPPVCIAVYERYLQYEPDQVISYLEILKKLELYDKAAVLLKKTLDNPNAPVIEGKTSLQLWRDLCNFVAQHPTEIKSIDVEEILRSGIKRFTSEVAKFWCALASYCVMLGNFEKARDIYEEGIAMVFTAYDFGIIFDAYAKFMESLLVTLTKLENVDPLELDLTMKLLEDLLRKRPLYLSSVRLRQHPHSVGEWIKRVKLFEDDANQVITTFSEALLTIDPFKCTGRLPQIWIEFAKFYEERNDLKNCRSVYERAVKSKLKNPEDLAFIWCTFIETELRCKNYKTALETARRSVQRGPTSDVIGSGFFQKKMCRNVRLWSLCLDLEECLGTPTTLRACVEKMFDLKTINPSQLLNYTVYLEKNKFWEESFRFYERGIAAFRWPYVYDVWITYLAKFISRYGSLKIERARELFDQALHDAPKHLSRRLYLMFGKLEEEFGLARHALAIYEKAAEIMTEPEHIYKFYSFLIAKTIEYQGALKTRSIYEKAIDRLTDSDSADSYGITMCLRFSTFEKNLGEIDRARAILQHCSQFCDPETRPEFWQKWRDFEVAHGNEDLFREMLRIKRSVKHIYSNATNYSQIVAL